ncbi:Os02g0803250 [Oryza sativa Japonica Group]|uniref:Os02g0803250 protein n=1 Tax=Oryza sativa subsp. japonica TaxID=39947 RepID=A0A0P0VR91_ORYSJ|nr:hypothetical protein EE612_014294 [Oryza sativa]BAS81437.1 Os02g0803250 [Oryza sativa Japonica Group]
MEASSSSTSSPPPPPPPSIPASSAWADASPLLDAACRDLQDGELIHGENFSLFGAMSALEIMDPKMDCGIEKSGYYSIDEAIEDGIAPVPLSLDRTLDIQRTLDVMDHLFSCEEEDLFTMSFGLPLRDEGDEKCLSILNSVEETIARQLRACKAQALSRKKTLEGLESLQDNPDLEEDYCRALLCRLRFRKHFYHVVTCLRKPHGRGLELAQKHVASCLTELSLMLNSRDFLRSQSNNTQQQGDEICTTASGVRPVGFDASLNSRLLSPAPPRAVKLLSWSDAIRYFEKLLRDLDIICSSPLDPVLENVLHFVVQFQKSVPDLVPRAFLQTLLVQDGKLYGRDLSCDVISRALSLPDIIGDKEFQMNEFVVQLGQMLAALRNESNSFQLPSIFNSEQEVDWRFIQHFDLLQKARLPEHITYYSFRESASHASIADLTKYNFFKEIHKITPSLRGSFASEPEKLAEIRQIEQVAEHNRIALNIISQVGAGYKDHPRIERFAVNLSNRFPGCKPPNSKISRRRGARKAQACAHPTPNLLGVRVAHEDVLTGFPVVGAEMAHRRKLPSTAL